MKVAEFRIGNLAFDKLTNETLICSGLSCDSDGGNSRIDFTIINRESFPLPDGWQANPIPLTEEWLLKFGFEKNGTMSGCHIYELGKYRVLKSFVHISPDYGFTINGVSPPSFSIADFNTVDQLQNLYHALTGEELILKQ